MIRYAEYDAWISAMKAQGHKPRMEKDGTLDVWVCSVGFCNGPGCEICGESWCMHCYTTESILACDSPVIDGVADQLEIADQQRSAGRG